MYDCGVLGGVEGGEGVHNTHDTCCTGGRWGNEDVALPKARTGHGRPWSRRECGMHKSNKLTNNERLNAAPGGKGASGGRGGGKAKLKSQKTMMVSGYGLRSFGPSVIQLRSPLAASRQRQRQGRKMHIKRPSTHKKQRGNYKKNIKNKGKIRQEKRMKKNLNTTRNNMENLHRAKAMNYMAYILGEREMLFKAIWKILKGFINKLIKYK